MVHGNNKCHCSSRSSCSLSRFLYDTAVINYREVNYFSHTSFVHSCFRVKISLHQRSMAILDPSDHRKEHWNATTLQHNATLYKDMSSANRSSKDGIDIRLALEILSARSAEAHTHSENGEAGCHHHAPNGAAQMGQTIDLNQDTTNQTEDTEDDSANPVASAEETVEEKRKRVQEERDKRRADMKQKLESMSVKNLTNAVLDAQQQRVMTYREYERYVERLIYDL